jgi:hypothetical protein
MLICCPTPDTSRSRWSMMFQWDFERLCRSLISTREKSVHPWSSPRYLYSYVFNNVGAFSWQTRNHIQQSITIQSTEDFFTIWNRASMNMDLDNISLFSTRENFMLDNLVCTFLFLSKCDGFSADTIQREITLFQEITHQGSTLLMLISADIWCNYPGLIGLKSTDFSSRKRF